MDPITVLILCRNRPVYLWACLDSLYRYTRHPARFILLDNASDDPLVRDVVAGFERRNMFAGVEWHDINSPKRVAEAIARYRDGPSPYLALVESDVCVFESEPCWLSRMAAILDARPDLALLGSYLDIRDFIDLDAARASEPDMETKHLKRLIKAPSSERKLPPEPPDEAVIDPFNPPGRLILLRKAIIDTIPFGTDTFVADQIKAAGMRTGIATQVRHRHLSLLNFFDYPDYDQKSRDEFFAQNTVGSAAARGGA